jgi:hypothetical protein
VWAKSLKNPALRERRTGDAEVDQLIAVWGHRSVVGNGEGADDGLGILLLRRIHPGPEER